MESLADADILCRRQAFLPFHSGSSSSVEEANHVCLQIPALQWVPLVPRCDPLGWRASREQGREGCIWLPWDWNSRQVGLAHGVLCAHVWLGGAGPLKSSVGLPAGREGAGDRNVGTSEEK